MRVLFIGPSLYGYSPDFSGISVRPPAMQGDIARAVLEGATSIGLVDGFFDAVAAPWHKEILFALASGVTMLGSSSMGALRAAECRVFGMRPIGSIARAYSSGALDDDAAVAISHGPPELGYPPLTEPLVNVKPTLALLRRLRFISVAEQRRLWGDACRIHFKDRSDAAMITAPEDAAILAAYRKHRINRKAEDALLLVTALRKSPLVRSAGSEAPGPASLFAKEVLPDLARQAAAAARVTEPAAG